MGTNKKKTENEPVVAQNQVQGKSAPTPTMEDANNELFKLRQAQAMDELTKGAVNGMGVGRQPIGKEQVQKAKLTLKRR